MEHNIEQIKKGLLYNSENKLVGAALYKIITEILSLIDKDNKELSNKIQDVSQETVSSLSNIDDSIKELHNIVNNEIEQLNYEIENTKSQIPDDNYGTALGYYANCNNKESSVCLGAYSKVEREGEIAHNINRVDTDQENNITIGGFEVTTSNATPTTMLVGGKTGQYFTVRPSSVLSFKIQIAGRDNTSGDCNVYHVSGAVKRDASGNTSLVGSIQNDLSIEEDTSWGVSVTADDTNDSLQIVVTGDTTNVVQWVARLDGVETHF